MTLSLAGVLADARNLWRSERELLVPIAGVFFFLPMLGLGMLLAWSGFPGDVKPEQLREAVAAFYAANLVWMLVANLMFEFGNFAILNLLLQGKGRTLGEVLLVTLRRFLPFLGISIIGSVAFSIGSSLFVLPGLFAFGRTWLAAPAYAAAPEAGPIAAFRQGWRRSAGLNWLTLLAAAGITLFATLLLVLIATTIIGGIGTAAGGQGAQVTSMFVTALIGGFAWTALALLRVAAYRRSELKQGM